jgi:predicted nucleic acid-binding protein
MRLVVLDTNVIVSAAINPVGPPGRIVMDWVLEGLVQPVLCPSIAGEYRQVLGRAKFQAYGFPPYWLEFLIADSLMLEEPEPWPVKGPDPDDLRFLALAQHAGSWLVSGNLAHFPVDLRQNVTVVHPAQYLSSLSKPANRLA